MTSMFKKLIFPLCLITAAVAGVSSCSDNDEPMSDAKETVTEVINELDDLQKNLARIDEDGSLKERVYGVVLDAATPTTVSVGVDNYDEAREIFSMLFSDTTSISADGTKAQFATRQGSAELKTDSGADGLLAHAEFDVDGLRYVDRINFIANTAWPENAGGKGFHKLGVQYMYKAWTGGRGLSDDDKFDADEMHTFVCIREYCNGIPALLVGISSKSLFLNWRGHSKYSGNMPNEDRANEIAKILNGNWDFYQSAFNANNKDLLAKGRGYWINEGHDKLLNQDRATITLDTDKIKYHGVHFSKPRHQVLFFLLSSEKM